MPKQKILKYNYVRIDETKVDIDTPKFGFSNNFDNLEDSYGGEDVFIQETDVTPEKLLEEARAKAADILSAAEDEARENAARIEEEARKKADAYAEKVEAEAREDGYKVGYNEAIADCERIKQEAENVLKEAKSEKERILDDIEPQVAELITDLTGKILGVLVHIDPSLVLSLVKKGLSETKSTNEITVRVSENEYDAVIENKNIIPEISDPNTKIEIVKDYSLKSGDCILETEFGNIDCSIDEQFRKLRESIYLIAEKS